MELKLIKEVLGEVLIRPDHQLDLELGRRDLAGFPIAPICADSMAGGSRTAARAIESIESTSYGSVSFAGWSPGFG
jgi:hypothetical protein